MKVKRSVTYTIPTWAEYYFQTGDISDMSAQEVNTCNRWLESRNLKGYHAIETEVEQDPYFAWRNDMTNIGDTVIEVTFIFFED